MFHVRDNEFMFESVSFPFCFWFIKHISLISFKNARTGGQQVVDKTLLRCLHVAQHVLL